jgi:Flp pilus assembly protein TadD
LSSNEETLIRGLIQQAEKAAAAGQRDEAQRVLAQAKGLAPEHPMVLNACAINLLQSGNAAGARELLERASARDAGNPALWMNLATALRALDLRD